MRLSGAATVRIGGSGEYEGNEFYGNEKGVVTKASGNPFYKVIVEGNEFHMNNIKGIGANSAYLEVRNNYINNKYAAGIGIKNSTHAVIMNNEIDNSWLAGVAARDSFIHLENNILAGNQYGRFGPVVMLRE
jgi:parallel beta-helix repeat protein